MLRRVFASASSASRAGNPSWPVSRWVLISSILASGMVFIDGTALSVAMPALQADLAASGANVLWVTNGFSLPLAALLLFVVQPIRYNRHLAGGLSALGALASFAASVTLVALRMGADPAPAIYESTWLPEAGRSVATIGMHLDGISASMLVVVSLVALCVQLFSLEYMETEPDADFGRYFTWQSLFLFSMAALVVAPNILQLFAAWELVGLCSYLLIGFYYKKPSAARAALKAFWVTKFADLGLLIGPAGLFWLNLRRHPAHGDPAQRSMDRGFIALLFLISLTGLALMIWRDTGTMGLLLAIHLGRIKDAEGALPEQISLGKLNNVREAIAIARECRTLLGGSGITLEYSPLRHANNLESVLTYEGTSEMHMLSIGRALTGQAAFR